jgi:hypothetical protein
VASKDDVPGSKRTRKSSAPDVVRSLAEHREALDLQEAKAAFDKRKGDNGRLAIALKTTIEEMLSVNRELELLAGRIAELESDAKTRKGWADRHKNLRNANAAAYRGTVAKLLDMVCLSLLTGRPDEGLREVGKHIDEEIKTRDWLHACAGLRKLYMVDMTVVRGVPTLALLQRVDERAATLTEADARRALRKGSASDAAVEGKIAKSVGVVRFAARLAARCGALGRAKESTLVERFNKLLNNNPVLKKQLE